jgi:hypothetical protein
MGKGTAHPRITGLNAETQPPKHAPGSRVAAWRTEWGARGLGRSAGSAACEQVTRLFLYGCVTWVFDLENRPTNRAPTISLEQNLDSQYRGTRSAAFSNEKGPRASVIFRPPYSPNFPALLSRKRLPSRI